MSIQEITVSHNQKKKLLRSIGDDDVVFKDDNGDIVVSVKAYLVLKQSADFEPIETIVGEDVLNYESRYFLFS